MYIFLLRVLRAHVFQKRTHEAFYIEQNQDRAVCNGKNLVTRSKLSSYNATINVNVVVYILVVKICLSMIY